jgi:hypothetical protein
MPHEWHRDGFTISTDHARLDLDAVYEFLSTSYWARGIPRDVMERSIAHAVPFGIYEGATQVGFARVVTDRATVAYIGVFVLEPWRGAACRGGSWVHACAELQGFRRCADARRAGLYGIGFRRSRPRTGGWRSTRVLRTGG